MEDFDLSNLTTDEADKFKSIVHFLKSLMKMPDVFKNDVRLEKDIRDAIGKVNENDFIIEALTDTINSAYIPDSEESKNLPSFKRIYLHLVFFHISHFDLYIKLVEKYPITLKFVELMFRNESKMMVDMLETVKKYDELLGKAVDLLEKK